MTRGFFAPFAVALAPVVVLATLNCGGYRYGASDQAFYVPAVLARLNPALYPHDRALIHSQARLTFVDETVAATVRLTGLPIPQLFVFLYLASIATLAAGATMIASALYRTRWALVALLAALTLRHAIARSGTNTLEGYFHPRQIAFALGVVALGGFFRGWGWRSAVLVIAGGLVHPTTAFWFAAWLTVAAVVAEPKIRLAVIFAGICAAALGVYGLTAGPLAGRLSTMDQEWVQTLATKDYLFPLDWPAWVWLLNVVYVAVITWVFHRRRAAGLLAPREAGVVAGCLALVALFFAILPFNAARVQLAVQLQPARIFWMLDFLAVLYAVWALAEGGQPKATRARTVAVILIVLSIIRGAYVKRVVAPKRAFVQVDIQHTDWARVMAWARQTPPAQGWLADPLHAILYGTSVRVAGERDVFVEAVKDVAIGMYDRDVALRTRDRLRELGEFESLTEVHARDLAARYDLQYLVTERPLALPVAYSSGPLRVYQLR